MAWDFKFDPVTRDLIADGKGAVVKTQNADTMMMHQIDCHLAEWWGDETLGSLFWDLKAFQARPEVMVVDEAKRAFGVLVARGRITNFEVRAEMQGPGRVVAATRSRDANTGQIIDRFAKPGG